VVPCKSLFGTGSPLQAFICGLQGVNPARCVNVPSVIAISRTVKTAIGLRRQLFSPSPERKGRRSKPIITTTGPMSSAGVSIDGGSNESKAYSHRKK
jgi:hypothetical protein